VVQGHPDLLAALVRGAALAPEGER
jgi:hypothetical protein